MAEEEIDDSGNGKEDTKSESSDESKEDNKVIKLGAQSENRENMEDDDDIEGEEEIEGAREIQELRTSGEENQPGEGERTHDLSLIISVRLRVRIL